MIGAVLLAAGSARRFGGAKLLGDLRGRAVVRWSADALVAAGIPEPVIVVPPGHLDIRAALSGVRARFVVNPEPERGIGRSLALGVAAVADERDWIALTLGDEPGLDPAWIGRLATRRAPGIAIVAATFAGERGHPVLFHRSVFPELLALDGDRGARAVVDRDPARAAFVELGVPHPIDVDTPEDLARLREAGQFTAPLTSGPS